MLSCPTERVVTVVSQFLLELQNVEMFLGILSSQNEYCPRHYVNSQLEGQFFWQLLRINYDNFIRLISGLWQQMLLAPRNH